MIKETSIQLIRDADIVSVIQSRIPIKKNGAGYKACCPFHTESTPSFTVSATKQIFKCFGCGEAGNVISFVMKHDNVSYIDAVKKIASEEKIELEFTENTNFDKEEYERKITQREMFRVLQSEYATKEKNIGIEYWTYRGINLETCQYFGIGYCDNTEMKSDFTRDFGITNEKGNHKMYKRATNPITDKSGNVIAFAGRKLDDENKESPKYINSPETELYVKGNVLYNWHSALSEIRKTKTVFITEGYSDVWISHQSGIKNIVATCGTALTMSQIELIKSVDTENLIKVVLCYNSDNAGIDATNRATEMLLKVGFPLFYIKLKSKDLLCQHLTNDKELKCLSNKEDRKDAILLLIQTEYDKSAPTTPTELEQVKKKIGTILINIPNQETKERYAKIFCQSINEPFEPFIELLKPKEKEFKDTDTPKVPKFPIHLFPKKIQIIIDECHKWLAYPIDFTATGILAAVGIAVGRKVVVDYIWEDGVVQYIAIVAYPGTNKTFPLKFALRPIMQRDKEENKRYKNQREAMLNGDLEPNKVKSKQTLYSDFTIESLADGINDNLEGIAVYVDELNGWFANFERYNAGSQQEFWLENWSRGSLIINRKGKRIQVDSTDITVVGTIQPSLLDRIAKNGRGVNGFTERFLFCYPDGVPIMPLKMRKDRSNDALGSTSARYMPIINNILDIKMEADEENNSASHHVIFDEKAEDYLTSWINLQKIKLGKIENEYVRNVYSKIQTIGVRFCLTLEMLDWACAFDKAKDFSFDAAKLNIKLTTVKRAIELAEYFLINALKANAIINFTSPIDKLASNFRNFYRELPEEFKTNDAEVIALKYNISRIGFYRFLKGEEGDKKFFKKVCHGTYSKSFF